MICRVYDGKIFIITDVNRLGSRGGCTGWMNSTCDCREHDSDLLEKTGGGTL